MQMSSDTAPAWPTPPGRYVPARPVDGRADLAACREALRHGSRSFLAASLLLPADVRAPACALYAFCRAADDAVDAPEDTKALSAAHSSAAAVQLLHARLAAVYAGRPHPLPADRALAEVVDRFAIPRALPEALLQGFAWDAEGRGYDSFDELLDYAARVAGTVGAMMALLMGVRSPAALARACDLGVAMQLSNIARDVGEDARMGRLYLPRQWLREAGLSPDEWLAQPRFGPALAFVVRRLLDEADVLYARVDAGVALLPPRCRPGINAARFLYAAIGHEVARNGLDSVSRRAVVPGRRKLGLLARALLAQWPAAVDTDRPPLRATAFLVDAVRQSSPPNGAPPAVPWWALQRRFLRTLDLFDRLERRERAGRAV